MISAERYVASLFTHPLILTQWKAATGAASRIAGFEFSSGKRDEGVALNVEVRSGLNGPPGLDELPLLRNVRAVSGPAGFYESCDVFAEASDEMFEAVLDRRLLYHSLGETRSVVGSLGGFQPVEEWPLILAFYHMASVARYNPEFLDQLRESRYWPVVAALTGHGLYKFLVLFWSFIRNADVQIQRM